MPHNLDQCVVRAFGEEWNRFDQRSLAETERREIFDQYFRIFPWSMLPENAVGFDLGCGSGRWAYVVAPRVGMLHCIDASEAALDVAKQALRHLPNCTLHLASVDAIPLEDNSMDFGYSLGVLHHIPDTAAGIQSCVTKLKVGAPLLLYLYYAFDNRPMWFRAIWRASDLFRSGISRLPFWIRYVFSQIIATVVYFPLARLSLLLERFGLNVDAIPLSWYRDRSFYTIRTDALDRFGTRLEKRFTAIEIRRMMEECGLERMTFSDAMPYWCVIGFKKPCAG
jgi:SAM-dependent methyltransferase